MGYPARLTMEGPGAERSGFSFDEQAASFDARAGLSNAVAREVASAVVELGRVREGDSLVEIGAGTGELGCWLSRPGIHYYGIDSSLAMLEKFRSRLDPSASAKLICVNADLEWPIENGRARLIFGSRVFHLLNPRHVVQESWRVAHPDGATLLMGKVKRSRDSIKFQIREKMRELLEEHRIPPRASDRQRRQLLEHAAAEGGEIIESVDVAAWNARPRPIDSIQSWRDKESMGGIIPPKEIKTKILRELEEWANKMFGDLRGEFPTEEKYVLEGIRISGRRRTAS